MISRMVRAGVLSGLIMTTAEGRIWTDTTGRKIDAEILAVEGDKVVLQFKGKRTPLALDRLSAEDRSFAEQWTKDHPAGAGEVKTPDTPAGELKLCGTTLSSNGSVNQVQEPLSAAALKSFSKAKVKPTLLKMAVALPAGFDPAKPQHVMWVSAAINNDDERKNGNCGAMGMYAGAATAAGWLVIAADTELGNPRMEDNQRSEGGDLAVHQNAVEVLAKTWPGFKTWTFACCGFSGGAKASFYRVGDLLASELNVAGMFLAGCNQDLTADAREETRCRKAGLRKIRVFISNGKSDTISSMALAEAVESSVKGNGYGDVRLEPFEGDHSMNRAGFEQAMAWFKEPPEK